MCLYNSRIRVKIWPVKLIQIPQWARLLSILRWWFCFCLFIVYCCYNCLWGVMLSPCFIFQYFMSILVMHSSCWGRQSWLLYNYCILGVMWLLPFFAASSWCCGLDSSVWLWHFLVIFSYCLILSNVILIIIMLHHQRHMPLYL